MIVPDKNSSNGILLSCGEEAVVFIRALNFLPLRTSDALGVKHFNKFWERRVEKDKECWNTS